MKMFQSTETDDMGFESLYAGVTFYVVAIQPYVGLLTTQALPRPKKAFSSRVVSICVTKNECVCRRKR